LCLFASADINIIFLAHPSDFLASADAGLFLVHAVVLQPVALIFHADQEGKIKCSFHLLSYE
jgi:hypothetical protein